MVKTKILFISTKSVIGGAQRYIVDLVDYLPKDEFEVAVAAGGSGHLASKIRERGIPYYEIRGLGRNINAFQDVISFFSILALLLKLHPDIVHLNGSKVTVTGAIAGRIAGTKKIVASTHGWPFLEDRPHWQRKFLESIARFGARFQSAIICVSEFDYHIGVQYKIAPEKKLILIHNGVDPAKHIFLERSVARERLLRHENMPVNRKYFIVGTIAEYTKNKGLDYIVEAAPHIISVNPNVIFFLVGWGGDKERLRYHIETHDLQKNIFLVDYLPEAFSYLKAFDLFLLASVKEGFAYTLLEASLAQLPLVATRVGGNPELVSNLNNGILIEPTSPDEIINAVSHFIRRPKDKIRFGENARKKAVEDFSITTMLEHTKQVYLF